jgi:hypothetical protein
MPDTAKSNPYYEPKKFSLEKANHTVLESGRTVTFASETELAARSSRG